MRKLLFFSQNVLQRSRRPNETGAQTGDRKTSFQFEDDDFVGFRSFRVLGIYGMDH